MDLQIQNSLYHVANRFRLVRMGWLLATFWLCLAVLFLLRIQSNQASLNWLGYAWIASPVFIAILWLVSRIGYRDPKWVASQVESRFPDLKQRLITVASPATESDSKFLRKSLVRETVQHARSHDWQATVSTGRLLGAWFIQLVCLFLALSASVYSSSQRNAINDVLRAEQPFVPNPSLSVDPGDIEIERGTDLVVTARFGGWVPQEVWLVTSGADPSVDSTKSNMQPSLNDPIFGGYVKRVEYDISYHIESEKGTSESYRVKVFDYPAMLKSDAQIDPPAYANQEKKTILDTKRVSVPEGTKLTWVCTVNKPLAKAELVDQDDAVIPLSISESDPLSYTATIELFESRRWKVRLVDSEGRQSKVEEILSAKVIVNKEPDIKLAAGGDLQVSPLQEVLLQGVVRDDFQLARTGVTVTLGDSEPIEVELAANRKAKGSDFEVSHVVDLESMNAQPDQLLSYFFWAEDTDRDNQTRRVDGEMFFAEVRPFEEIFREGESQSQSQQQQQTQQGQQQSENGQKAEELAELQKKIISGTWNVIRREVKEQLSKSFSADVQVLSESQQTAMAQTDELEERVQDETSRKYLEETRKQMTVAIEQLSASEISLDKLKIALNAERKAYEGLLRLRAREHSIVRNQQQQNAQRNQSSAQQNRQQQLEQLKLEDEKNEYESEQNAAPEQNDAQREVRQVMNRLEELARRQKDLNQQIKEAETALREAESQAEKEQLQEQLARLREDQEEMVRDADELLEKMNQDENRQEMQEAREQVEQAREQLQKTAESLANNQTSQALNSGTRAEQTMKDVREQIRQESSSQMQESMQNMVQKARELEADQQELQKELSKRNSPSSKPTDEDSVETDQRERPDSIAADDAEDASPLRPEGASEKSPVQDEWRSQKEKMDELLEEMKNTVSDAESSEPLLADNLYEGFREAKQSGIDRQLEQIPMLIDRGFENRAQQLASEATQGITKLKEKIEKAAESVLGSEQESLRRALREIDRANQQLNEELESQSPGNTDPQSESNPGQQSESNQSPGEYQSSAANQQQGGERSSEARETTGERSQANVNQDGSSNSSERPIGDASQSMLGGGGRDREINSRTANPITGDDYREWIDSLRDVEELLIDPDRKADVARIRDAAREMRVDFKRHSKEPQWDLVRKLIADPLKELRSEVNEELMRLAAERNALVPIDRDPVPSQYQKQLDRYYENLGRGNKK
ncbi:MAG: hypothetical protein ACK506_05000 [Pirellula sp.]